MVHLKNRAWQILVKCERLLGFWPYYNKIRKLATIICIPSVILSCTATVIIRLLKEWNVNIEIVIEDALLTMCHFTVMAKFCVCIMNKPRREIFEKVDDHIETIVEEDEAEILKIYANSAVKSVIQFCAFIGGAFALYDTLPVAQMYFYYFLGIGKLEKRLPFAVDYLVDEQEYFYYILAHLSIVVIACWIVEVCFNLNFVLTVRHVCALFEIVNLRLKAASNIFHQYNQDKKFSDSDEQRAFKIISSAVDLHIEAIRLCRSVNAIYRNCLFIVLLSNMAALAPLPIMAIIYMHYPLQLFMRCVLYSSVLAHFYIIFLQGQLIINHSSSIYDTCRDFHWCYSSKRCRAAISMIMMQSMEPCRLTGVLFDLSMETYCNMLKTALSYTSMFAALDITI